MAESFYGSLARSLKAATGRLPANLVPAAHAEVLFSNARYIVLDGGRDSAKSWSIARRLLQEANDSPQRVLCTREIQSSLKESAFRLLVDQISLLGLDSFYEVMSDQIVGRNGSLFFFAGLLDASKIRSFEGIARVWIEEAQSVSELSFEQLLPTIRKRGSKVYISFNPMLESDPVYQRFVVNPPPSCARKHVTYRDNPYLSPESRQEIEWLKARDHEAYLHIYEGQLRQFSDSLIFANKYASEPFEPSAEWIGPLYGLDYGFGSDPCAATECYIDDTNRRFYVRREFWQLKADLDKLPQLLMQAIPNIADHSVYCDAAQPGMTKLLANTGLPGALSAEKWQGSVLDGIGWLRSFEKIVIHPDCRHVLDELGSYSYRVDRLTNRPTTEPADCNNHCIDSIRYACFQHIRSMGGSFDGWLRLVQQQYQRNVTADAPEPYRADFLPGHVPQPKTRTASDDDCMVAYNAAFQAARSMVGTGQVCMHCHQPIEINQPTILTGVDLSHERCHRAWGNVARF
jgi:phage terminase large subunit